jgi:hypothetical protein
LYFFIGICLAVTQFTHSSIGFPAFEVADRRAALPLDPG